LLVVIVSTQPSTSSFIMRNHICWNHIIYT
jgi:hypothetical protein